MSNQLPLLSNLDEFELESQDPTIQARFEEWIANNPTFWRLFVDLCFHMRERGLTRWGSKAAVEELRYGVFIDTQGDIFKIPNSFTSRLARKAIREYPELDGLFELRELTRP